MWCQIGSERSASLVTYSILVEFTYGDKINRNRSLEISSSLLSEYFESIELDKI